MATWNYRLVKFSDKAEPYYEVREVHYDDAGRPVAMTANAATFGGDTPEEVSWALDTAAKDVLGRGLFVPPPEWVS